MKALTIYQPWASLIMAGAKPYEFRGWSPRERGGKYAALIGQRIVIHASVRKIDRRECLELERVLLKGDAAQIAATCLHRDKAIRVIQDSLETWDKEHGCLPWGAGLGTAVLGEPRSGYEIAEEFGVEFVNDSDRDNHANYGWPMLDIEVWPVPIVARGYQGFWNWCDPEMDGAFR